MGGSGDGVAILIRATCAWCLVSQPPLAIERSAILTHMDHSEHLINISRLGMPLEQYILTYRTNEAMHRPSTDWTERIKANIEKVSEIGREGGHISGDISISTIRPILLYSYSPFSYRDLSSPPLIRGCLKIMCSLKLLDISPFSHELGYACFRIITLALGLCLAQRAQGLGLVDYDFDGHGLRKVSQHVAELVNTIVLQTGDQMDKGYNCILGWFDCRQHSTSSPIISLPEARTLLELLFDDRQRFIRAIRSTYQPCLPTIVFFLWRFVCTEQSSTNSASTNKLNESLQEVFWRCWIVSTAAEEEVLKEMAIRDLDLWQPTKRDAKGSWVDREDAKELIGAFTNRLTLHGLDPSRYHPLSIAQFTRFIGYLQHRILPTPGCDEHSARCFGAIMERLWSVVCNGEDDDDSINVAVGCVMSWFSEIDDHQGSYEAGLGPKVRIIDEIINTDCLNLVARVIFRLTPSLDESPSNSHEINVRVLIGTQFLLERISKFVSVEALRKRLHFYVEDWWKVYEHIMLLGLDLLPVSSDLKPARKRFYRFCLEVWERIGQLVYQWSDGADYLELCHNLRCPTPILVFGIIYRCSYCHTGEYCSTRCQAKDWLYDYESVSHRWLCAAKCGRGADMPMCCDSGRGGPEPQLRPYEDPETELESRRSCRGKGLGRYASGLAPRSLG
ncbi:hypothetical protein ACGC1H_006828 [Rhizoctonia solani]